jgi:hypothetical protein
MAPEPIGVGAASPAISLISNFLQHFKPSRSPYLLVGVSCVICLLIISNTNISEERFVLIFIPLGTIFSIFSILCFYFKPYKLSRGKIDADLKEEIEDQFMFSRTLCLTAGVIILTYLFYESVKSTNVYFFWISYVCCLIYISTFLIYIIFFISQEENPINLSILQITFFTVAAFSGLVVAGSRSSSDDGWIYSCTFQLKYVIPVDGNDEEENVTLPCDPQDTKRSIEAAQKEFLESRPKAKDFVSTQNKPKINKNKLLFWYFILIWICFQAFWTIRLSRTVKFSFAIEPP